MRVTGSTSALAVGLALIVAGGLLLWWGYSEAESLGGRLASAVSGAPSDRAMFKYIAGAVGVAVGLVFVVKK